VQEARKLKWEMLVNSCMARELMAGSQEARKPGIAFGWACCALLDSSNLHITSEWMAAAGGGKWEKVRKP
jgi:hypothetical protein